MRRDRLMAVPLACAFLLGVATAGAEAAVAPRCEAAADVRAPNGSLAWRAELLQRTPVRARLASDVQDRVEPADAPALLVLDRPRVADGRCWVKVRLPSRPNDATGWLDTDTIQLRPTAWRIVVTRSARRVDVLRDGKVVRRFSVVIGAPSTPTPAGLFAITQTWRGNPGTFLGSWVLSLSAHSDVLMRYDGGDGRAALHGRGGASFLDPLGTAASHGCVRLSNETISWLVRTIGRTRLPGTPVHIQ